MSEQQESSSRISVFESLKPDKLMDRMVGIIAQSISYIFRRQPGPSSRK